MFRQDIIATTRDDVHLETVKVTGTSRFVAQPDIKKAYEGLKDRHPRCYIFAETRTGG